MVLPHLAEATISNAGATIIGAVIGVFGLIFVAVVGAAWRSINHNLDTKFDGITSRQDTTDASIAASRVVVANHGERLAYIEGRLGYSPGTLHRPPNAVSAEDVADGGGG